MARPKEKDFNKALPQATAEKFEVVNIGERSSLVVNFHGFGTIDFRSLSVEKAEFLVSQKAPFLQEKKASKPAKGQDDGPTNE